MKWYKVESEDTATCNCKIDLVKSDNDLTKYDGIYVGDEEHGGDISVSEIDIQNIKEKFFQLIQNVSEETMIQTVLSKEVIDILSENDFLDLYLEEE